MSNDEGMTNPNDEENVRALFRHFHSAVVAEDAEWPPRKRATQIKSKHNFEELDLVVPARERIISETLLPCAVSGRRPRIKHLEWITAAKRSRNHSLNLRAQCDRRRCRHCPDRLLRPDRRSQRLGGSRRRQRRQDRDH